MIGRRLCRLLLPVAAAAVALSAVADSERERREAELEELREQIDAVRERLAADREQRDDVSTELERIERRISMLAGDIAEVDRRIGDHQDRLEELADQRARARQRLDQHRGTLAKQLRAAYRLGRQPALRILLRQDQPDAVARAMEYYSYFNEARLGEMEAVTALLGELRTLTEETEQTRAALADDRDKLDERRVELGSARAEREDILARIEERMAERGERLDELEEDREQLQDLLDELSTAIDDIPDSPLEDEPFDTRAQELAWPVSGALRETFGSARADGRMRWQGLVIDAEAGSAVRAVYHGRVVFADWLSGFGQLIILDHQDGYMSLYGYNQRLLRSEGEWVGPGDRIATVGRSGAQTDPGLYFEIRQEGQPQDPLAWLQPR